MIAAACVALVCATNPWLGALATGAHLSPRTVAGSLTVTPVAVAPTEGTAVDGTIATLSDSDNDPASNYTASINWGDGTTSAGAVAGSNGSYAVSGTHTYADEAAALTLAITVTDSDGSQVRASESVDVSEGDNGAPSSMSLTIGVNQTYSGPVAGFTDFYTGQVASDFTATVNWGDGVTTTGVVSGGNGSFVISGTHAYTAAGTFPVIVLFSDDPPSPIQNYEIDSTASVVQALSLALSPITTPEGTAFNGPLGTLVDNVSADATSNYSAVVAWGDGSTSTAALSAQNDGSLALTGSHTYADEGPHTVSVSVSDSDGASITATTSATVSDSDSFITSPTTIGAVVNTTFSGSVGSFTDANPAASPGDLTATINWGDGSAVVAGAIVAGSNGFSVNGSHTYTSTGTFPVTVTVAETAPGTAAATFESTAVITNSLPPNLQMSNSEHLNTHGGTVLAGGYDFSLPASHAAATITVSNAVIAFTATCRSGLATTILLPLPNRSYALAAHSGGYVPSASQNDASTYQARATLPAGLCDGQNAVINNATLSSHVAATAAVGDVHFRFHVAIGGGPGPWSGESTLRLS